MEIINNKYRPSRASYKVFKLTNHARQRAKERLHIQSEEELKKLARAAKYNGLNIYALMKAPPNSFSQLLQQRDLSESDGKYLISKYILANQNSSSKNNNLYYFYKEYIFVFSGQDGRTLVTIVPEDETTRKNNKIVNRVGLKKFNELFPDSEYYRDEQEIKFKSLYRNK